PHYREREMGLLAFLEAARDNPAIREHVNRYVAHLDFDLLAGTSTPPPDIELEEFDKALANVREFINGIGKSYFQRPPRAHHVEAELIARQAGRMVEALRKGIGPAGCPPV
ncbi:MAG: hypothetical protein LC732_02735, partial [Acidobacteria bacterium]|nr:hypothetical protein [Acidobacteriota bacterium]